MPTAETQAFFEPFIGKEAQGVPMTLKTPIDELYVFSERQISALLKTPAIWDVLSLIMAFTTSNIQIDDRKITETLRISQKEVLIALEWLRNEGLVTTHSGVLKAKRDYYHLPNTDEFKPVRDSNFRHVSEDIINKLSMDDLKSKEAYRTTFLRRLNRKQARELCDSIDQIVATLGNFDDRGTEYYGLTVAFGPRAKLSEKAN